MKILAGKLNEDDEQAQEGAQEKAKVVDEEEPVPKLLVIGSSIQVLSQNPIFEGWHHNLRDLDRLLLLLEPNKKRVVFVSGDVHFAEVNTDRGFLEIVSSGITHKVSMYF